MKVLGTLILGSFIWWGCAATRNFNPGTYYAQGKDYSYKLELRRDSTFHLSERVQEGQPECVGQWSYLDDRTIQLNCNDEEELIRKLSNGYMSKRVHNVTIVGSKRLLYKGVKMQKL